MNKLLTIAAVLIFSTSAFAEFEGHLDMEWLNSIGSSNSQSLVSNSTASQPEIGSTSSSSEIDYSHSVLREVEDLSRVNEH